MLTIDEAIEILESEEEDTWMGSEKKWKEVIKLAIIVLKLYSHMPQLPTALKPYASETKEKNK